jgi:hypothetical protein
MVHSSGSSDADGGLDAVHGQGDMQLMQVLHDGESMKLSMMAIDRVSNSSTGLENFASSNRCEVSRQQVIVNPFLYATYRRHRVIDLSGLVSGELCLS